MKLKPGQVVVTTKDGKNCYLHPDGNFNSTKKPLNAAQAKFMVAQVPTTDFKDLRSLLAKARRVYPDWECRDPYEAPT